MTENELVEMMYAKHKKWLLNAKEASSEWGRSYSTLSKLFGGEEALPKKMILEKQIIPPWVMLGQRRMWKITDIAKWLLETERSSSKKNDFGKANNSSVGDVRPKADVEDH